MHAIQMKRFSFQNILLFRLNCKCQQLLNNRLTRVSQADYRFLIVSRYIYLFSLG